MFYLSFFPIHMEENSINIPKDGNLFTPSPTIQFTDVFKVTPKSSVEEERSGTFIEGFCTSYLLLLTKLPAQNSQRFVEITN